jgi:hypothetical protein
MRMFGPLRSSGWEYSIPFSWHLSHICGQQRSAGKHLSLLAQTQLPHISMQLVYLLSYVPALFALPQTELAALLLGRGFVGIFNIVETASGKFVLRHVFHWP